MNDENNTLIRFGKEFQNKCVAALISDKSFFERIFDILKVEYFETESCKWIISTTIEYYIKYKDFPTLTVFKIKLDELENEVVKGSIIEHLKLIYSKMNDIDLPFIKEQFLEFCCNQKMKNAILASVDYLKLGQFGQIKNIVDEALKAGMERNLGHNYMEDIDKRMSSTARDCIKTGWEQIDELLDGGLAKGELGFIVGSSGSGKSWMLARLGAEAMKQGKNVAHFTLELNENYVGLRYDSCFTGIDFQEIRNHREVVERKISDIPGKLFIKYFPLKTVSPQNLKMHIERLQMINSIKIDLIVVDYADILKPTNIIKNANSYTEAGNVYEELRTVAGELQKPCWSASQSNRWGASANIIQAQDVADSYRKIMTGDVVLSLSRKMEDKVGGVARIHIIKNRFGPDGITLPSKFNSSNGDIKVFDPSSSEGIELQRNMDEDNDDMKKDILKDQWNKLKNKKKNSFDDEE